MKNIIISLFFIAIVSVSCKDWLDVNTDPNYPSSASIEQTYPSAVASTVAVVGDYYTILGGFWAQYFTQNTTSNQYKNIDAYNLLGSDFNNEFTELYSGALNDYKYVKTEAYKNQNWSYYLMATVMESYTFQILADLYDQIPFSEADRGAEVMNGASVDVLSPHYEKGQAVYDSLIARIDTAMSKNLHQTVSGIMTSTDPSYNDFIFGTDLSLTFDQRMNLWRQFANTLKLKIFLRESYARPQIAQSGIQAMVSRSDFEGFLTTPAAFIQFRDEANRSNPFYESNIRQLNTADNIKASSTLVSYMTDSTNDPRLGHMFTKVGGRIVGNKQGDFANPNVTGSSLSTLIQSPTDAVYLIMVPESYFLQAEAVLRGFMQGDAQALYNSGITASFTQWKEDPAAYLAQASVAYPAAASVEGRLRAIITQKWASMAPFHGLEAFFEYNRTHYPSFLTYSVNGVTGANRFPKRLVLPETEQLRNKNAPPVQPIYTKVWWDVKP